MPFKKGAKKPSASGRKKGTSNKATLEIKTTCRDLLDETYFRKSAHPATQRKCAPQVETMVHHYAFGKPKDRVEIEGTGKITVDQFRALAGLTDDDDHDPPPSSTSSPPSKKRARVRAVPTKKKKAVAQTVRREKPPRECLPFAKIREYRLPVGKTLRAE